MPFKTDDVTDTSTNLGNHHAIAGPLRDPQQAIHRLAVGEVGGQIDPMLAETQHRFSVSDYSRMAETGVLGPDALAELLDGKIIDIYPIGPFHGGVLKRLIRIFNQNAKSRWVVSAQDPLHLDDISEPPARPDAAQTGTLQPA